MKLLVFLLLPCLSLSEVVTDFTKCNRFFLNKDPPKFTAPTGVSVQHICQCLWDDSDQKMYLYATLYSSTWRIPIYSAYMFGSQPVGRCDVWYVEPQLDAGRTAEQCMSPKGHQSIKNQAVNSDYDNSGYDRGHLYPVQHTDNHLSMLATSTLTNVAPQDSAFNRNAWKEHEKEVINNLSSCDKAYVVTGVVPDTNRKIPVTNPRVTVSNYYWRATCCEKNGTYTGKGYFGPDQNGEVKQLSIQSLQAKLDNDYKVKNLVIFPSIPAVPGKKRPSSDCN